MKIDKHLIKQIFVFGVVGGVCFFVDYGFLLLFTELCSLHVLLSTLLAFVIANIVNYFLSMRFVFERKENFSRLVEFLIFFLFSVIGLGLTELIMWLGTDIFLWDYRVVKIVATLIVMAFNFVSKKLTISKN